MAVEPAGAKEVFTSPRHMLPIAGREVDVKLGSSFNFNEVAEMGSIQEEMDVVLEEAREAGAVNEDGEVDMTNVKYSIRFLEYQLRVLHMHIRDFFTWEEMKLLPANELEELRYFLDTMEQDRVDEIAERRDKKKQQRLISQKKSANTGKT